MSPERYQRVKEVFLAVCERPVEQRDQAVASLCGEDAELKSEVDSLLESHSKAERQQSQTVAIDVAAQPAGVAVEQEPAHPSVAIPQPSGRDGESVAPSSTRGRFAPGKVLCDRYRIVSLLGTGGMGEVYRADDLVLDQPVALKFLPQTYGADPTWLQRFHNEVRMSRQVTHPNVCRVFDIGNVEGEQFISMEFVDGEDLASLLRRIGRLPRDKAIQISRQLCAGLAAAHDRGVLHRDLKPANVMIDGRGQVRITDFGISGRVDGGRVDGGREAVAGTPAYMAPEQFSRGQATVLSDIYSLGLVIYEIFTGHQAFNAHSLPEFARLHRHSSPTNPSTIVEDMDPLVERVILRCLEKDPTRRPPSALAVSAALPGGDPLAAALAAGETPSPEMVAAAGETASVSVVRAGILLGLTLVGLIGSVLLAGKAQLASRLPLPQPPDLLVNNARQILATAGYTSPLVSHAHGFQQDDAFVTYVRQTDSTPSRWAKLAATRPSAVSFWYRESPTYLISQQDIGMVTLNDPARDVPGMRSVVTDTQGRLQTLEVLPANSSPPATNSGVADFSQLFALAGLSQKNFRSIPPTFTPPMYADSIYSWSQRPPADGPAKGVVVQAASLAGQPVYFNIVQPWQTEAAKQGINPSPDMPTGRNIFLQATMIMTAMISSLVLAWRNVRAGRGDWAAAQKLSGLLLALGILIFLLCANHVPQFFLEFRLFFRVLGFILVPAAIVWMFYLALEPYVRRIWPETVISWNRLLAGRFTDSLVAYHVLMGLAAAAGAALLAEFANLVPMWLGRAAAVPAMGRMLQLLGKENAWTMAIWALLDALCISLLYLLSLVLFELIFRRRWLASLAFVLLAVACTVQWYDHPSSGWRGILASWPQCLQAAIFSGVVLLLLVRFGLVATVAGLWAVYFMRLVPMTADMTLWYSNQVRFAIGLLAVVAIAAATLATAGWRTAPAATAKQAGRGASAVSGPTERI